MLTSHQQTFGIRSAAAIDYPIIARYGYHIEGFRIVVIRGGPPSSPKKTESKSANFLSRSVAARLRDTERGLSLQSLSVAELPLHQRIAMPHAFVANVPGCIGIDELL